MEVGIFVAALIAGVICRLVQRFSRRQETVPHVKIERSVPVVSRIAPSRDEARGQLNKDEKEELLAEISDLKAENRTLRVQRKTFAKTNVAKTITIRDEKICFLQGKLGESHTRAKNASDNLHHNAIAMGDNHDREVDRAREEVTREAHKREHELEAQLGEAQRERDEARKPDNHHIKQIRELKRQLEEKDELATQREALLKSSLDKNQELQDAIVQETQEHEATRAALASRDEEITRLRAEAVATKKQTESSEASKRQELEQEKATHQKTRGLVTERDASIKKLENENAELRDQLAAAAKAGVDDVAEEKRLHEATRNELASAQGEAAELKESVTKLRNELTAEQKARRDDVAKEQRLHKATKNELNSKNERAAELNTKVAELQRELAAKSKAREDALAEAKRKMETIDKEKRELQTILTNERETFATRDRKELDNLREHTQTQANRIAELEKQTEKLKLSDQAKENDMMKLNSELAKAQEKLRGCTCRKAVTAEGGAKKTAGDQDDAEQPTSKQAAAQFSLSAATFRFGGSAITPGPAQTAQQASNTPLSFGSGSAVPATFGSTTAFGQPTRPQPTQPVSFGFGTSASTAFVGATASGQTASSQPTQPVSFGSGNTGSSSFNFAQPTGLKGFATVPKQAFANRKPVGKQNLKRPVADGTNIHPQNETPPSSQFNTVPAVLVGQQQSNGTNNVLPWTPGPIKAAESLTDNPFASAEQMERLEEGQAATGQRVDNQAIASQGDSNTPHCQNCGRELLMGQCPEVECIVMNWAPLDTSSNPSSNSAQPAADGSLESASQCEVCGSKTEMGFCPNCFGQDMNSYKDDGMTIDTDMSGPATEQTNCTHCGWLGSGMLCENFNCPTNQEFIVEDGTNAQQASEDFNAGWSETNQIDQDPAPSEATATAQNTQVSITPAGGLPSEQPTEPEPKPTQPASTVPPVVLPTPEEILANVPRLLGVPQDRLEKIFARKIQGATEAFWDLVRSMSNLELKGGMVFER